MTSPIANRRGFTLVELLTVVVIIAVLVAIAMPTIKSFSSTAVQAAARQVSTTLQLTRQAAINNRLPTAMLVEYRLNTYPTGVRTDLVCRAYCVVKATNDVNGTVIGWIPIQDWKLLPDGVFFSDLTAGNTYTSMSATRPSYGVVTIPAPAFYNSTTLTIYIPNTTASYTWTGSMIVFRPAGGVDPNMFTGGVMAGGLRIVQGAVLTPNASTPPIVIINNTNNWVYIEFDQFGRVRTRLADSYN